MQIAHVNCNVKYVKKFEEALKDKYVYTVHGTTFKRTIAIMYEESQYEALEKLLKQVQSTLK